MEDEFLKQYICTAPFTSLEIQKNQFFLCCPSWLNKNFDRNEFPLTEIWNSKDVQDVRRSILDGNYKYCNRSICPHLNKLINFKNSEPEKPIYRKDNLPDDIRFFIDNDTTLHYNDTPDNVIFNFDRTCNYKCPSCRIELIVESKNEIIKTEKTIEEIDQNYSRNVKTIYITGTGDPFVSVAFRNYLRNFNPLKYPQLKTIHLHTNASMWDEEMWMSMKNVHKYVKSCEISIDAATKDTYENKVRLGGNWDKLITNLKFISTIKSLKKIKTSFVVQKSNYKEMSLFVELMENIFGNKNQIFFNKIINWGTFSEEDFKDVKIWERIHKEHNNFIDELLKITNKSNISHNFFDLINTKKNII
jgi:organic radical activating enzyme